MSIKLGDENIKVMYKYRTLTTNFGEINKNTLGILENGILHFSKPSTFNDPFDSKIEYDLTANEDQIRKYIKKLNREYGGLRYINENDFIVNWKTGRTKISDILPSGSEYLDSIRIYCLSKDEKNILMWSHYGSDHTGICIGFRTNILLNAFTVKFNSGCVKRISMLDDGVLPLKYVEYAHDRPKPFNPIIDDTSVIEPFMFYKSKFWEYEKELRIILHKNLILNKPITIDKNEIVEIVFGIKTNDNEINFIKDLVTKNYPNSGKNVALYKCEMMPGKYELTKKRI
jgi:hypothetical protein